MKNTLEEKHLHIVCLDVPYPVDYGGVFDLFYKIKSLYQAGIRIHLHCFEYGRGQQPELDQYCEEVHYYKRLSGLKGLSAGIPYIVASRANEDLLQILLKDDHPILFEGMHCTYFVHTGQLPTHRCFVRLHNVEFLYYQQLAETTNSVFKKVYFKRESKLLRQYEIGLANKATFWTVTETDLQVFHHELGYKSIDFLPLFLPDFVPSWSGPMGNFCLYHGNLSVPENEYAATWLLEKIFSNIEIPFVVAGKNPSARLQKLAHAQPHTCIVANPGEREMEELIRKAQVNILPSFNSTGIKLKLINALYHGRHCLVNDAGVEGSNLRSCCEIANCRQDTMASIERLFLQPFNYHNFTERMTILQGLFNNQRNAEQLINWIFNGEQTLPGTVGNRWQFRA